MPRFRLSAGGSAPTPKPITPARRGGAGGRCRGRPLGVWRQWRVLRASGERGAARWALPLFEDGPSPACWGGAGWLQRPGAAAVWSSGAERLGVVALAGRSAGRAWKGECAGRHPWRYRRLAWSVARWAAVSGGSTRPRARSAAWSWGFVRLLPGVTCPAPRWSVSPGGAPAGHWRTAPGAVSPPLGGEVLCGGFFAFPGVDSRSSPHCST